MAVSAKAQDTQNLTDRSRCGEKHAATLVSAEGTTTIKLANNPNWLQAPLNTAFCTGDRISVTESRAAVRLINDTIVRLDVNTSLTFLPQEKSYWAELLDGVAHFITRTPKSFQIKTGALNAAVDGTEFIVSIERDQTRVLVIEGSVVAANKLGSVDLVAKEQAVATESTAPIKSTVISLVNSVDWALHYPPVSFPTSIENVDEAVKQGRFLDAYQLLQEADDKKADDLALEASLALNLGRVAEAEQILRSVKNDKAENIEVVRALLKLVYGQVQEAQSQVLGITNQNSNNAAAWQVLSYTQQANFKLEKALESTKRAEKINSDDGVVQARLAELSLMRNQISNALRYSANAIKLAPKFSRSHTINAFAQLNRRNISAAKKAFQRAADINSADPQAALGLGLINVRKGNLLGGREYLELAAALDPTNSLPRSVLGKLYYEINRNDFAQEQFNLAKEFDPNDPTPWFYNALKEQDENNPAGALKELKIAQEKNDNRAVYRSRLLLDKDEAARGASLGNIYRQLGFDQLALREGTKAIEQAPDEYAGHRLVAESYIDDPFHQSVRTSEALQARIHQPIGTAPLPIGLGETGLFVRQGVGPSELGLNEFTPLFIQEGFNGRTSVVVGTQDTKAFDASLYGNTSNFSMNAGIYNYASDGFRVNNDADYEIRTIGAQYAPNDRAQFFVDYTQRESDAGDLSTNFDPDNFSETSRQTETRERFNLGTKLNLLNNFMLLASVINEERETDFSLPLLFPGGVFLDLGAKEEAIINNDELQIVTELKYFRLSSGIQSVNNKVNTFEKASFIESIEDWDYQNYYTDFYSEFSSVNLKLLAGLGFESISGDRTGENYIEIEKQERIVPRFGLSWTAVPELIFRTAYSQNFNTISGGTSSLRNTHVFGFLTQYDELPGLESKNRGVGLDFSMTNVSFGAEFINRDLRNPLLSSDLVNDEVLFDVQQQKIDHEKSKVYLAFDFSEFVSFSSSILRERYVREIEDSFLANLPTELDSIIAPQNLTISVDSNLSVSSSIKIIKQNINLFSSGEDTSTFSIADLTITHKLPNRSGAISLGIFNMFDREFDFQDSNFLSLLPRRQNIVTERSILLTVEIEF